LIGASIEGIPVPLRFTVEDLEGDAYIAATSTLPINEPVLRLIVEVNWSSGRLLREYTLFLDPPAVPEAAPAPRIDQRKAVTAPLARQEAAPAVRPSSSVTTSTPAAGAEYGPVRSGETLWGIASGWSRGSDLSVNQVMIAIQRENPSAFVNGNINLLKRGAILRMPDPAEVELISAAAAYREVAAATERLRGDGRGRSVASPATPLLSEEAAAVEQEPQAAAAEATTEAMDEAGTDVEPGEQLAEEPAPEAGSADTDVTDAGEEQDVLELIPPAEESELDSGYGFEESEQPTEAGADVQVLRETLARTEEELINQQQQNSYLEERIRELESELESLGEGADADLANMEARLRTEREAAASQQESSAPWYSRLSIWLVGLLVLVAGLAGWLLSRRGQFAQAVADSEASLRGLKSEAEDVLRVLGEETKSRPRAATPLRVGAGAESADQGERENVGESATAAARSKRGEDEAELLDEASSDPEIQLDLARAYISMGDKEAARVILQEVVSNGTEEQQAEANKMLERL